ncbi:MAG TPA: CHASE domain-containing protein [Archangium sp.]|nr:CHASE domain-containing protein [Archangium sp.]
MLVLSLLLTSCVCVLLGLAARARDEARFENLVQTTSDRIQRRLDTYVALLQGTKGLFATQQEVTPEEFSAYVQLFEVQSQYPGIQGLGFTRRFSREERARVERQTRTRLGLRGFQAWPEVVGDELHSIVLLEPRDLRNLAAMGYNMYSEPMRREAMARARDTGLPALTGKVTLKQEIHQDKQAGFLLYLPVYRGGRVPATLEERREALAGFVYSPFRADDLLNGIFGAERQPRVAFQLYDGLEVDEERRLHSSHGPEVLAHEPMLTTTTTLLVAGRPWTLTFSSLPAGPVWTEADPVRLVQVLEMDGHQVTVVHDGRAALERMGAEAPEVIFLDIGLPGMDGYEVARRIRERSDGAGPRLVAVTGHGQASDRQRSREAGFDAHLVKPVELERVRELVADAGERGSDASALN